MFFFNTICTETAQQARQMARREATAHLSSAQSLITLFSYVLFAPAESRMYKKKPGGGGGGKHFELRRRVNII